MLYFDFHCLPPSSSRYYRRAWCADMAYRARYDKDYAVWCFSARFIRHFTMLFRHAATLSCFDAVWYHAIDYSASYIPRHVHFCSRYYDYAYYFTRCFLLLFANSVYANLARCLRCCFTPTTMIIAAEYAAFTSPLPLIITLRQTFLLRWWCHYDNVAELELRLRGHVTPYAVAAAGFNNAIYGHAVIISLLLPTLYALFERYAAPLLDTLYATPYVDADDGYHFCRCWCRRYFTRYWCLRQFSYYATIIETLIAFISFITLFSLLIISSSSIISLRRFFSLPHYYITLWCRLSFSCHLHIYYFIIFNITLILLTIFYILSYAAIIFFIIFFRRHYIDVIIFDAHYYFAIFHFLSLLFSLIIHYYCFSWLLSFSFAQTFAAIFFHYCFSLFISFIIIYIIFAIIYAIFFFFAIFTPLRHYFRH